ncbi:SIMPL domain-containing protein [Qipengyuania qiaonensis]|uniref:SIMPL domain-containing protein n=1 Tax=Qipengyuania qiaonensis TaxID=2867240 RepID=A0ABS7J7U6_9SPHN|nr:SIMPL domain-containing protein [Qipengyuania qiaonensis]MBX7482988.1 SIMPL domain-containing protein [Qipengyuania qiaonensis]
MIRFAIPALAAATIASNSHAAEVQIQSQGPVVELSVSETVDAKPDTVNINAGVTSQAGTAVEAMRLNAQEMTAVIDRITALGIDGDDIQTSGINLGAQYDYDQATRRQVFRGYQASNRVNVTLRQVPRAGEVLDALVAAGATDIGGPSFSLDDDTSARAQARRAAFDKARTQAEEYARWSGFSGVRLLEVNESIMPGQPAPFLESKARQTMDAAAAPTPVEPGLVGTMVSLTVKFEMTR